MTSTPHTSSRPVLGIVQGRREKTPEDVRHVRRVRPLQFPASDPEWEMSESHRHQRLCELLYQLLRATLGEDASVGADQFVYFDAADPKRKCAPDGFVKLLVPAEPIEVWKTWEQGVPELCVEILSPSDTEEKLTLPQKLRRFHTMGVREVVTFHADAPVGKRIRAWDLLQGDLVERAVEGERTRCFTLGNEPPRWFVVAPYAAEGRASVDRLEAALRLAEEVSDERGETTLVLVPTPDEADRASLAHERALREEAQARAERERAQHEEAARRADAEIALLREELQRR